MIYMNSLGITSEIIILLPIAICTLVAYVIHVLVEEPMMKYVKKGWE